MKKKKKIWVLTGAFAGMMVIYALIGNFLANAKLAASDVANETFKGFEYLFAFDFAINIAASICVVSLMCIIKEMIKTDKRMAVLPIGVTALLQMLPLVLYKIEGIIGSIVFKLVYMPHYLFSIAILLCFSIGYTVYEAIQKSV